MPRLPGQTLDAYDGSLALKLLGLRGILLLYTVFSIQKTTLHYIMFVFIFLFLKMTNI